MARELQSLRTERLILRNISIGDTKDIVAWRSDPKVYCYFLTPHSISVEEHIYWFENRYLYDDNRCDWMALDEKKEPIGVFGIRRENSESVEAEISYILAPDKRGVGYASEAVRKIIEYASRNWNTERIIAEIHIENLASINFAKNLGMHLISKKGMFCVFLMSLVEHDSKIIYIRCDGNQWLGIGHVMRCLAIAKQVKQLGNYPVFLVAEGVAERMISENGYSVICLNTEWNNYESEIELLKILMTCRDRASILVDSYYITDNYLRKLKDFADVTYIDDLGISKYDIKNLVNYNYYASDMDYEEMYDGSGVSLYLGPKYAPLRSEFEGKKVRSFAGIKSILITTGGTDKYNVTDYLIEHFISIDVNVELYIVVGKFNNNQDALRSKYEKYKYVHLLINVSDMQEYMMKCDLCITAGGSTLYELCACGTPSLMYVLADNQENAAKKFNDTRLIPCLGDARSELGLFSLRIDKWLLRYSEKDYWEKINRELLDIVDAKGAGRIARVLCGACSCDIEIDK